jgi:hypothetical protein
MFNGRNRFNGFTTEKPVCVLRLDSARTEVKRKNGAPKILYNQLILKAFIDLTELEFTVPRRVSTRGLPFFIRLIFATNQAQENTEMDYIQSLRTAAASKTVTVPTIYGRTPPHARGPTGPPGQKSTLYPSTLGAFHAKPLVESRSVSSRTGN